MIKAAYNFVPEQGFIFAGYGYDPQGNKVPFPQSQNIQKQFLQNLPQGAILEKNNVQPMKDPNYNGSQSALNYAKEGRNLTTVRTEYPNDNQIPRNFNITFDNTEVGPGQKKEVVVLGDAYGLVTEYANPTPTTFGDKFKIGGNYNEKTLSLFQKMIGRDNLRIKKLQLTVTAIAGTDPASYFNGNPVTVANSKVGTRSINLEPINFEIGQDGSQFQQNIRRIGDEMSYIFAGETAFLIDVPIGFRVSMNFEFYSLGQTRDQMLLNS